MISVAMAAWRGEKFIASQLKTLLDQSRRPDEIVICDDSSDGATEAAVVPFLAGPVPVRYFRNPQPLGASANFGEAIRRCSGDWIFLCDQDDLWDREKIRKMADLFPAAPELPAAVCCDSLIADEAGEPTGLRHWATRGFPRLSERTPGVIGDQLELFLRRVPAAGHDMAINRALRDVVLPIPALKECHDTWIGIIGALLQAWRLCPEPLTRFRRHASALSGSGCKLNLLGELRAARRSIADNTFAWNAALFSAALERCPQLPPEVLDQVRRRRDHSLARANMNVSLLRRLPLVIQEWKNGNYSRFGRSWRSVVQDLLFRSPIPPHNL